MINIMGFIKEQFTTESRFKIAVIEDDKIVRRLVRSQLEKIDGHIVAVERTGENAIGFLTSVRPDALLLDWKLPNREGIDILKDIKKNDKMKSLPVIMMTGNNKINDMEHALALGASSYITKPLNLGRLSELLLDTLTQQ